MAILIHSSPGRKQWPVILVLAALTSVVDGISLTDDAGAVEPRFEITTDDSCDTRGVPAYQGRHDDIYDHIDQHLERHVGELQRWVRQPSVSPLNAGITENVGQCRLALWVT